MLIIRQYAHSSFPQTIQNIESIEFILDRIKEMYSDMRVMQLEVAKYEQDR